MFSSTVRSALFALAATALSVNAAPGLTLKVSGPGSVNGVDSLKLTTTLVNTGDETLKLLNDPRGALHTLPTNTFSIVNEDTGASPAFSGAKAKYVPAAAAKVGKDDAFTILAPGASIDITHNLGAAYNFTASGAGSYSIEPSNLFHYVDASGTPVEIRASIQDAHVAKVAGKLAVARPSEPALGKRATYRSCSSTRQSQLVTAASSGNSYASSAYSYANSHTSATTRYTTWFGTYTSSRHSTVVSHYQKISSHDFGSYTFDCTCTDSGTYAYVYPDTFGVVYLCGAFWSAPNTGTDSRAGTLVHESSHFTTNGGTDDYVYGQSAAKSLASSNPDQAVFNADNHEYFAENTPAQS